MHILKRELITLAGKYSKNKLSTDVINDHRFISGVIDEYEPFIRSIYYHQILNKVCSLTLTVIQSVPKGVAEGGEDVSLLRSKNETSSLSLLRLSPPSLNCF